MLHRHILRTAASLLLGWGLSTGSMANSFDRFLYYISVINQTPFPLKVVDSGLLFNRVESANQFTFLDEFVAQDYTLAAGATAVMGEGTSGADAIDGYFLVQIEGTNKSFEIYYHLLRDNCSDAVFDLRDSQTGEIYPLLGGQQYSSCYSQERFPWFVPLLALDYVHSYGLRLITDSREALCMEDDSCTSDSYMQALIEEQVAWNWSQKEKGKGKGKKEEASTEPQETASQDLPPADRLVIRISFVNETPFPLTLLAHQFTQRLPLHGELLIRFTDAFQTSSTLQPGATVTDAVYIMDKGMLHGEAAEGEFLFLFAGTDRFLHTRYSISGTPGCQPKITLGDTNPHNPGPPLTVKTHNSCRITSSPGGDGAKSGTHSSQNTTIIFLARPGTLAHRNQNSAQEDARQPKTTGNPDPGSHHAQGADSTTDPQHCEL